MSRVSSIAAFSLALPTAARCDRPNGASASLVRSCVGGLAQGPDEKRGLAGRVAGCEIAITATLPDKRLSLGRGVPRAGLCGSTASHKSEIGTIVTHLGFRQWRVWRIGNLIGLACVTPADASGGHIWKEKKQAIRARPSTGHFDVVWVKRPKPAEDADHVDGNPDRKTRIS